MQHVPGSWNNIPINQSEFRDNFTENVSILALQPELRASTSLLFNHHFPLILGINYG